MSIRFNLYGNCYNPVAVGLKPSAMRGEARLRGLELNNYSKTNILLRFQKRKKCGVIESWYSSHLFLTRRLPGYRVFHKALPALLSRHNCSSSRKG